MPVAAAAGGRGAQPHDGDRGGRGEPRRDGVREAADMAGRAARRARRRRRAGPPTAARRCTHARTLFPAAAVDRLRRTRVRPRLHVPERVRGLPARSVRRLRAVEWHLVRRRDGERRNRHEDDRRAADRGRRVAAVAGGGEPGGQEVRLAAMIAYVRDDPSVGSLVVRARDGDQGAGDRLVERLETIREPAALPGWLATTARHECLHLLRARNRQVLVGDDERMVDGADAAADEWLLTQERHIALRMAFDELPPHCRQLLSMLFDDPPMSYAQVSAATGTPLGAIGPTRQRCLAKLRRSPALLALFDAPSATAESR